ncbi:MAG: methyltransferase domain-containing protein [bacterium]|nr:methyltransferase domain-containing protein [bacterium]
MNELLTILGLVVLTSAALFLGWWLLIASEGVYLGRRVVVWLYDVFAPRYDAIKHFRREYDHRFLAQPLMARISPNKAPLILDVATGTGRLPLAMIRHAHFEGKIIGVDLSEPMLRHAWLKFIEERRVMLLQAPAERLPFASNTFDGVSCLEALEFMIDHQAALAEMVRVLKPGGVFLITNRINTRWMPGKTYDTETFVELLFDAGIDDIHVEKWQVDYDRVWGIKPAEPSS